MRRRYFRAGTARAGKCLLMSSAGSVLVESAITILFIAVIAIAALSYTGRSVSTSISRAAAPLSGPQLSWDTGGSTEETESESHDGHRN